MRFAAAALACGGLLSGCAVETYDVADLQLDVAAPLPIGAETLHVCVTGVGMLDRGAGNGRMAFPGLPVGDPAEVTVDVLDADGALLATAGPAVLDGDAPWATTPLGDPQDACHTTGELAPDEATSWLLVLRFAEDG
jgi:hypothetical protein